MTDLKAITSDHALFVETQQRAEFLETEKTRLQSELKELRDGHRLLQHQFESFVNDSEASSRRFRQALEIEALRAKDIEGKVTEQISRRTGMSLEELLDTHASLVSEGINRAQELKDLRSQIAEVEEEKRQLTISRGQMARDLNAMRKSTDAVKRELRDTREKLQRANQTIKSQRVELRKLLSPSYDVALESFKKSVKNSLRNAKANLKNSTISSKVKVDND